MNTTQFLDSYGIEDAQFVEIAAQLGLDPSLDDLTTEQQEQVLDAVTAAETAYTESRKPRQTPVSPELMRRHYPVFRMQQQAISVRLQIQCWKLPRWLNRSAAKLKKLCLISLPIVFSQ